MTFLALFGLFGLPVIVLLVALVIMIANERSYPQRATHSEDLNADATRALLERNAERSPADVEEWVLWATSKRTEEQVPKALEKFAEHDDVRVRRWLGVTMSEPMSSRLLLAKVLDTLGRSAEALPIIEDVVAKQSASPELGPGHPETLSSRLLLAKVLDTLGRSAEALPIIEDVVAKQSARQVHNS